MIPDPSSSPANDPGTGIHEILVTSAGFVYGFSAGLASGGVTGYFGNWLWEHFRPRKRKPHFNLNSEGDLTYFSGACNSENIDRVSKTLRYSVNKSKKPKIDEVSETHEVDMPSFSDSDDPY